MAKSLTFGSNLPKEYANLRGQTIENVGGGELNIPQYMYDLATASSPASTGAVAPTSPDAAAPVASPQRYAGLEWRGLKGREMLPSMKSGYNPVYQLPVEQLDSFMKDGLAQNYRVTGGFQGNEFNAPKVNYATYTNPLTGEVGGQLFGADKTSDGLYEIAGGGSRIAMNAPGWNTSNFRNPQPPVTEPQQEDIASPPITAIRPQPYVLNETPEEFRFAKGGLVEVADELRNKGRMGDTILAHISPDEARMLKMMGGAGTINPETGLPEYFSFKKLLGAAAPIIGNMIAPGIGGVIGGAAGGALAGGGAEGALMGGLGGGLGYLGGNILGGQSGGLGGLLQGFMGGGQKADPEAELQQKFDNANAGKGFVATDYNKGFMESLKDPKTLLALAGVLGEGVFNDTEKKNRKLLQAQRAERQAKEEAEAEEFRNAVAAQTPRTANIPPPDYYTYGTRPEFNYFSNNTGAPKFARGGYVENDGIGGGQDDTIPARLSSNEFVIPADVVSHLGDGTPEEGAKKLDALIKRIRGHKAVKGHPPKAKPVEKYMGGLANG